MIGGELVGWNDESTDGLCCSPPCGSWFLGGHVADMHHSVGSTLLGMFGVFLPADSLRPTRESQPLTGCHAGHWFNQGLGCHMPCGYPVGMHQTFGSASWHVEGLICQCLSACYLRALRVTTVDWLPRLQPCVVMWCMLVLDWV